MKKYFRCFLGLVLFLSQIVFGSEYKFDGKNLIGTPGLGNIKSIKQAAEGSEEAFELEHPLPNTQLYSLLDGLKPGQVLVSLTAAKELHAPNEFNDFPVVTYQAERYGDAFYFVPEKMTKDAEKALTIYGKTNPSFYAYLVPVKDKRKFLELIAKSSTGCANKGGNWRKDFDEVIKFDELFSGDYLMLDRSCIEHAKAAPRQGSEGADGSWSCGPNTGYRALRLMGEDGGSYYDFVKNCPRTISRNDMTTQGGTLAIGGGILGLLFAPFTGGLSLIPAGVAWAAGATEAITAGVISSDVGPNPGVLALYLRSVMNRHKAKFSGYSYDWGSTGYEQSIVRDIKVGLPRIVLMINGTMSMHYVNVIGVHPTVGGHVYKAVILDTDGKIGVMSREKLSYWLDRNGYAYGIVDARYNTVEFHIK